MSDELVAQVKGMADSMRDEIHSLDSKFREPVCRLFAQYLQDLKQEGAFSEIYCSETIEYTAFFGHRENDPDEKTGHRKEGLNGTTNGLLVCGSQPQQYSNGKSLELYLLEDGTLLECEVENEMSESPMSPTSHTTTKTYTLTRTNKEAYKAVDSFINHLDLLQLRDVLYLLARTMDHHGTD